MDVSGNKPIKVAVLYICTGRYSRFFADFYESAKRFLLKDEAEVDYFVFTDDTTLPEATDVHYIPKACEGFPRDTLMRFEMFLGIKAQLEAYDYIFFFNSNAQLVKEIGREILPDNTGLTATRWARQKPIDWPMFYPYERHRFSTAYIPPYQGPYAYYMGGFNGGTSEAYLRMTEQLAKAIDDDLKWGHIARHNDESHLNRYLYEHPCKELPKGYCCPEEWLPERIGASIVFRNKVTMDGYFDKGRDHSPWGRIEKGAEALWMALKWYF